MATFKRSMAAGVMVLVAAAGTASAQVRPDDAEQIRMRQEIAAMEFLFQRAIGNGAEMVIAQVRSVIPDRPRLGPMRISGFQLQGYGMVFHVDVPAFELPIMYEVFLRDMLQSRNAAMTLQRLKAQVGGMPPGRERSQYEALILDLEQQLGVRGEGGGRSGNSPLVPVGVSVDQKVVEDPESAYTREVKTALIETMLTKSQGLGLGPDEWLAVVARDGVPSNPQFPGDSLESSTWVMRVKGSVLAAFRAGTLSKDEAIKQVEVKEQ